MSKQASKTLIGGFLVGAIVLVTAGVLVFGSGRLFSKMKPFVMYFEGSVKGLNIGAPVVFRGVKIGSVTDIRIRARTEDLFVQIPVFIECDSRRIEKTEAEGLKTVQELSLERLLEAGLKAQLKMQSLVTGQMIIEMDFYPDKPIRLVGDGEIPEIPTMPSKLEELADFIEKAPIEEITNKLLAAAEGIEKVFNSPEMQKMPSSLNQVLKDVRKLVLRIDESVSILSPRIDNTVKAYGKLARNVDAQVQPLADSIEETVKSTTETLVQAKRTLSTAESLISENSIVTYELTNALRELALAAHSIRMLTEYLERHPEALVRGKGVPGGN